MARAGKTSASATRRRLVAAASTRRKETTMQDGTRQDAINQVNHATGKALDAMTLWADANQRVLNQLVEFGTGAAKESVNLYAELQQSALDAFRENQATALRWQSIWQDAPQDPVLWYQKSLADGLEGARKWFRLVEGNAQAVTKAAERLQASTEHAGRGIQQAVSESVNRLKDVYAKA
jgi:hypothetical protein